jgi:hypothetical protein
MDKSGIRATGRGRRLLKVRPKFVSSNIGCSFKFPVKVGVEESIVNAPLVRLQSKNTNNAKSEVKLKQLTRDP